MKKQIMKWKRSILLGMCLAAAAVCCGCGTERGGAVLLSDESGTGRDPGTEDGAAAGPEGSGAGEMSEAGEGSGTGEMSGAGEASAAGEGDKTAGETGAEERGVPVVLYVYICGEVNVPGVYEMTEGSRIFQVVEQAGGFTEQAADSYLNMAQPVADGMKIVVPAESDLETADAAEKDGGGTAGVNVRAALRYGLTGGAGQSFGAGDTGGLAGPGSEALVNLNTAGKEELMTLKGIGEARAEAIIRYREEHGPFRKIEDVMKVSGIKEAAFEKIRDRITV